MRSTNGRWLMALSAVLVLVVTIMPVAAAQGKAARNAPSQAKIAKQVKSLQKKLAAVSAQLKAVQSQLPGKPAPAPTTLPPSGAAGGALTGTFPNPTLRDGSVGSAQVQDNSLTSKDILDGGIQASDLAPGSVSGVSILDHSVGADDLAEHSITATELTPIIQMKGAVKTAAVTETVSAIAKCPAETRLLSGGFEFENNSPGANITASRPDPQEPLTTWQILAINEPDIFANGVNLTQHIPNKLFAIAYCIAV